MTRYTRRPNYDRKLSRALVLADGRRPVTLRAAASVISDALGSVNPPSDTLDHAIALLLMAARSGTREHVAAATDEVERVPRDRQLLAGDRAAVLTRSQGRRSVRKRIRQRAWRRESAGRHATVRPAPVSNSRPPTQNDQ